MQVDSKTKVCCIIGNPVEHSLSPIMHNCAYTELNLNFVYVAFKVERLKETVSGIRELGIRGASVTIPHKVDVIPLLDKIDETARKIGAVNTVVNDKGILKGYNTDCDGAIRALQEVTNLRDKKVVLIGAGGAARAITFGLKQEGAKVLILNRTVKKAQSLSREVKAEFGDLTKLGEIGKSDILINATSVGMSPNVDESVVSRKYLHKDLTVFDIVYNPKETRLIQNAKKAGCKIVYGYKMLLYQAVAQFELFTKHKAPKGIMEELLAKELARGEESLSKICKLVN